VPPKNVNISDANNAYKDTVIVFYSDVLDDARRQMSVALVLVHSARHTIDCNRKWCHCNYSFSNLSGLLSDTGKQRLWLRYRNVGEMNADGQHQHGNNHKVMR
jgi:hypothetical protein